MNHHYKDIRDKLGEPSWWDEVAVPRYCDFSPLRSHDTYADEVVLLEIECQNCARPFKVCKSSSAVERLNSGYGLAGMLYDDITLGCIEYGDPPNVECCPSGATMSSIAIRVLEYWHRSEDGFDWVRVPALEIGVRPEWAR